VLSANKHTRDDKTANIASPRKSLKGTLIIKQASSNDLTQAEQGDKTLVSPRARQGVLYEHILTKIVVERSSEQVISDEMLIESLRRKLEMQEKLI